MLSGCVGEVLGGLESTQRTATVLAASEAHPSAAGAAEPVRGCPAFRESASKQSYIKSPLLREALAEENAELRAQLQRPKRAKAQFGGLWFEVVWGLGFLRVCYGLRLTVHVSRYRDLRTLRWVFMKFHTVMELLRVNRDLVGGARISVVLQSFRADNRGSGRVFSVTG